MLCFAAVGIFVRGADALTRTTNRSGNDMGDVIVEAAREIWALVIAAITTPGPYLVAGLVIVAAGSAVFIKGKIASLIWLPCLALAGFLAWRYLGH